MAGAVIRGSGAEGRPAGGLPRAVVGDARRSAAAQNAFPEIDCVRDILPQDVIAAAERRARAVGLGADRVLIAADAITEEAYLTALATSLGASYEPLEGVSRDDCPLDDDQLIQAAAAGLLPLQRGNDLVWIIAPRCLTARRLADPHRTQPQWLRPFHLTSSERLWRYVAQHAQDALGWQAADGLRRARPLLSNAPRPGGAARAASVALAVLASMLLALVASAVTATALGLLLCAIFLAAAALRLLSVACAPRRRQQSPPTADDRLPIYTVICALYREAGVVKDLVAAIRALDYPPEKLDVKFVVEADDRETKTALSQLDLGPHFQIITAPPIGPKTKPKALNVGLPLALGTFTVVYDAEDMPEPDQLRRAHSAFRAADERLACVQASLTIDNTADNWVARMFTADYAGQFDGFLPGLSALHLPFPLGGSSSHFRTAALRQVGGWDTYNVTEDADLGFRLCRFGYRAAALPSATYEEAPARFMPWLKQRTRWYKGWMQTWLVHSRHPARLFRELGPAGVVSFQLFIAGSVLAAMVHPVCMAGLGYALLLTPAPWDGFNYAPLVCAATLFCGYVSTIVPGIIGLKRRRLLAHAWVLALTPVYWLLLSAAAWRALFQLLSDPQRWEKTEHGLARTSRLFGSGRRRNGPGPSGRRFWHE